MKIVVIGGTGLIGSKVVAKLKQGGHEGAINFEKWLSSQLQKA